MIDQAFRLGWLILLAVLLSISAAVTRGAVFVTADGDEIAGDLVALEGASLVVAPTATAPAATAPAPQNKKLRLVDVVSITFSGVGSVPSVDKSAQGPLVVDNDGVHNMKMQVGTAKLKAGRHEFHLVYFQAKDDCGLRLSYSSPNIPTKEIPETAFSHLRPGAKRPTPAGYTADGMRIADDVADTQSNLEYAYYEAPAAASWTTVKDFFGATPKSTGFIGRVDVSVAERAEQFAIRFSGYLEVPADGVYTFYLTSDEGSQLFIGPLPPGVISAPAATQPEADTGAATRPVATGPLMQIGLLSGDKITGALMAWTQSEITLQLPGSEKPAVIPMKEVREAWRVGAPRERAPKVQPGEQDLALVAQDNEVQAVKGVVLGVDGESLKFRYNDEERKIALDRLVGLVLAAREYSPNNALQQSTMLSNGDVITGTWASFGPEELTIKTAWASAVRVPMAQVVRMDTRNGRLAYLSDLAPARVEQVPYFDRVIPYRVDRSLTGGRLKMSDGDFSKGVAMHSRCVLHYDIAGKYEKFRTRLGFQIPEGLAGEAAVRVLGDGKPLFEEAALRGDQKPRSLDLNIAGVKRLTLEVDFGQGQDVGDHVVWGNARLLRAE